MSDDHHFITEVDLLLRAAIDQQLDESQSAKLELVLQSNRDALDYYIDHVVLHAMLQCEQAPPLVVAAEMEYESEVRTTGGEVVTPAPLSPLGFLGGTTDGAVGHLFSGWPVAYLIAMVIFSVGILIGALVHVSQPTQIAGKSSPATDDRVTPVPEIRLVGRITGMVDCQWADGSTAAINDRHVSLGRKYALTSGLMEITYDTGAKVILQGPVTYVVESANGGFMAVGKLTGKVAAADAKGFYVRTPTATVTDLGTEFGIEVSKEKNTTAHVFRGVVKLQLLAADAGKQGDAIVLRENETVRTEKSVGAGGPSIVVRRVAIDPRTFVRRVAQPVKMLDLLDIVAQGDGTTHRRERGIDPTTGMEDPLYVPEARPYDGKYRPVVWHKLIDGVFVPDATRGPVQLDSAGHTFDSFPKTVTDGMTWGSIWSRAAECKSAEFSKNFRYWVYCVGQSEQFMPERRGLLGLHASQGITFNLAAMRTMYPGVRPVRFRATAGVADPRSVHNLKPGEGLADLWVFVDGQVKHKRTQVRPPDGVVKVDVSLGPDDRFLTLVSTDGGNGPAFDMVVFGDPVLDMVPVEKDSP